MAVEQVLVEFIADYAGLEPAVDMLERTGQIDAKLASTFKQTNAEINKQAQAIRNTAQATSDETKSIDQMDKRLKSFLKNAIEGFQEGMMDALNDSGVSLEEFNKALQNAGTEGVKSTTSLRQELKQLTLDIAQAKANGTDLGEEYEALVARAGELKDAIADAGAEISNAGSDTRHLDNILGTVQALAGGFAVVQGTAALFGNESEELQKTLLKVNAAMAVLQGLQSIQNAVQKEGAVAKLADVVATKAQIAVQRIYTAVTGQSTAATKAFKIALASTGIGLLVVGVIALVQALKSSNNEMERANDLIDQQNSKIQSQNKFIQDSVDIEASRLELIGAAESQITRARGIALQAQIKNIEISNRLLAAERDSLDRTSAAWFRLNDQIDKNNDIIRDLNKDVIILNNQYQKQQQDEAKRADELRKQRAEKAKQDLEKRLAEERAARLAGFEDFKAGIELQLLEVEKGSEEELEIKKKLLNAELQIALENEKLTANQRKLLIQQYFKDRLNLDKEYASRRNQQVLEDIASDLNAELQSLAINNERKLELTEAAIRVQAALEIEAANGNAAKIAEINAEMDRQIREARLASIRETFEAEERIYSANTGGASRALERVASDEKQRLEVRINAINQLEQREIESIQRRLMLNRRLYDLGLISQQEFNVTQAELLDAEAQAHEDAEKRKTDVTVAENEKRKADTIAAAQEVISVMQEIGNTVGALFQAQTDRENQKIDEQKRRLQELVEAGAITEKEALIRQKRIEAEERKARQQQAQREKAIAVFNSLLAIPQAFLKGLTTGGPILAAVYGGLAAVQAAIVAARPVPKFATGKKGSYEGPGIIGEAGAELIQRADGSMYVSTKPTLVYVGSKDKIFTAGETKRILPKVDRSVMRAEAKENIDYEKLAAAIIKGYKPPVGPTINIDREFVSESVADGLSRVNYFDRYYSSK